MTGKINIKEDFKIERRFGKYLWIILILLLLDQLIKISVFKNFELHEESKVIGDWFRIRLELNDGIAFSNPFTSEKDRYLKIFLKIFLVTLLFVSLVYLLNKRSSETLLLGLAFCLAGSAGNLIDRIFHGILLNNSLDIYSIKWFHGQIIDMFWFPIFEFHIPEWFPSRAGENFLFFEPVFNLADLILFVGGVITCIGLLKISKLKQIRK
jgi:signal peptidase II